MVSVSSKHLLGHFLNVPIEGLLGGLWEQGGAEPITHVHTRMQTADADLSTTGDGGKDP